MSSTTTAGNGGAGIGAGEETDGGGEGGDIVISGGIVCAEASGGGQDIGIGNCGYGGTLAISGDGGYSFETIAIHRQRQRIRTMAKHLL